MSNQMTDQEFRKAVEVLPDFELTIPAIAYLKSVFSEYGNYGKPYIEMLAVIERGLK